MSFSVKVVMKAVILMEEWQGVAEKTISTNKGKDTGTHVIYDNFQGDKSSAEFCPLPLTL